MKVDVKKKLQVITKQSTLSDKWGSKSKSKNYQMQEN